MTIAPKFPRSWGPWWPTVSRGSTSPRNSHWRIGSAPRSWKSSPTGGGIPTPGRLRAPVADAGLSIHSAHGCWGGQTIRAPRVDLGSCDPTTHLASVDDLKRCVDWLAEAGGRYLVVHPGGLSEPDQADARRDALARGLIELAEHARGPGMILGLENMPPGVHPGSRMADLFDLICELDRPELALDARHRPRPHRRDRRIRNRRRRPSPRDHPRPRQRRPTGFAPPPRARLHRLGRVVRGPRCHPLSRPDHARMHPAHPPQPAMSRLHPREETRTDHRQGHSDPTETPRT